MQQLSLKEGFINHEISDKNPIDLENKIKRIKRKRNLDLTSNPKKIKYSSIKSEQLAEKVNTFYQELGNFVEVGQPSNEEVLAMRKGRVGIGPYISQDKWTKIVAFIKSDNPSKEVTKIKVKEIAYKIFKDLQSKQPKFPYSFANEESLKEDLKNLQTSIKKISKKAHIIESSKFEQENEESILIYNEKGKINRRSLFFFYKKELLKLFSNRIYSPSLAGNAISDHFIPARFESYYNSGYAISPVKAWESEKHLQRIARKIYQISKSYKSVSTFNFIQAATNTYPCSTPFHPSIVTFVLDCLKHKLTESNIEFKKWNILDFSMGHGHRLLASLMDPTVSSYTGTDPNEKLREQYSNLTNFVKKNTFNQCEVKFYAEKAEDPTSSIYQNGKTYNVVLTSPPFFDLEIYDDNNSQSVEQFSQFDEWLEKFLFKSIENSWERLEKNGFLVLHISDIKKSIYNQEQQKLVLERKSIIEPMHDYIVSKLGGNYMGFIPIRKLGNRGCYNVEKEKISKSENQKLIRGLDIFWVFQK